MSRLLTLLLYSVLLLWNPAFASAEVEESTAAAFPDVSQIVPKSAELELALEELRSRVEGWEQTDEIDSTLKQIEQTVKDINNELTPNDPIQDWSTGRQAELSLQLEKALNALRRPLDTLTERLRNLAEAQQTWQGKGIFWEQWQKQLADQATGTTTEAMARAQRTIKSALSLLSRAQVSLTDKQQKATAIQLDLNVWKGQLDAVEVERRKSLFKRNELPLPNHRFLRQLSWSSLVDAWNNARQAMTLRADFWREQVWLFALQLVLVFVSGRFFAKRRDATTAEDWQFFMRHPWATGIFLTFIAFSAFYQTPPPLWTIFENGSIAISGCILVASLLRAPMKIFAVFLLTSTGVATSALQGLALPAPLYRVYIAVICLVGAPLLYLMAKRHRPAEEGAPLGPFPLQLKVGSGLLATALVAQLGGYTLLANRLVESGVGTFILIMVTLMLFRLLTGGIDGLVQRLQKKGLIFFQHYGHELQGKARFLIQILLTLTAVSALFPIWGLGDQWQAILDRILSLGISTQDVQLTFGMILSALAVLYIAHTISWGLQGLFEVGAIRRQQLDRGIRDSFKRLMHYLILLTGFLVAMNLAGIEIRHFAVLAGALGIGIGFGLQNIVNNFISGLILLFERPVKVGDMVFLDNEYGTIRKIGLRSTIVATLDQAEVIVPNSMLVSEKVTNWTLSNPMARVRLPVGVAYGSDVGLVLEQLTKATDHPRVLDHPGPTALFTGFGNSSLDFELQFWIANAHDRLKIKSEIGQKVDALFREVGIEIPFPQRDLHVRSVSPGIWPHASMQGPPQVPEVPEPPSNPDNTKED